MKAKKFFKLTLNKIVIAKVLGVPLIIADLFFDIFSYLNINPILRISMLLVGSYLVACTIDFVVNNMKNKN